MKPESKMTLAELLRLVRDKIYEALPGSFWVIAEVAEMKVNNTGHCYLELTGSDTPGGNVTARVRATIWASKFRSLNTLFHASTGIPLRSGITLLLKATVEYHELYGLSLNITDIDPTYTAGDMALRREAVIRRLTSEGVISMNAGLTLTPYPRNIAVISSSRAAGYQDFITHIVNNPYRYLFMTTLFEAVMQGEETAASVTSALNRIPEDKYDVVVIIRGGGSGTDLSWFDSYEIAYHVTQFPLPVLTGIGHEKDHSVTDMTAWKALKTPTAVAGFIIERTHQCENHIIEMAGSLVSVVTGALDSAAEQVSNLRNRTAALARLMVKVEEEKLGYHIDRLHRASKNTLSQASGITDRLERSLIHLDPWQVMKRGFTITTKEGAIIRSTDELRQGDTITTYFQRGRAVSTIEKTTKK